MLSVIVANGDEPTVTQMTRELLEVEKFPVGAELLFVNNWWEGVKQAHNNYICLLEPDCLVSKDYFVNLANSLQENLYFRKLNMMASAVGVNSWADKIYGYKLGRGGRITPSKFPTSGTPYPVEIGYVPGAIIRTSTLRRVIEDYNYDTANLIELSAELSFYFWSKGKRVHVNPSTTYVTTENYVGEDADFDLTPPPAATEIFNREAI